MCSNLSRKRAPDAVFYSLLRPSKAMRLPTIKRYKSYNVDTVMSLQMAINISSQENMKYCGKKKWYREKSNQEKPTFRHHLPTISFFTWCRFSKSNQHLQSRKTWKCFIWQSKQRKIINREIQEIKTNHETPFANSKILDMMQTLKKFFHNISVFLTSILLYAFIFHQQLEIELNLNQCRNILYPTPYPTD